MRRTEDEESTSEMSDRRKHILYVVGARPNFMKLFPLLIAGKGSKKLRQTWVHTGQHYHPDMTDIFFDQFRIPNPKHHLSVGSGPHGQQTGRVLERFEKVIFKEKPDLVGVVGDVNSTLAAALAAVKLKIPVAHVEAGLRSFDRNMPEEINRMLTDQIADYLFIPSLDARKNLIREGIDPKKIYFVGNIMIDTLKKTKPEWGTLKFWDKFSLKRKKYLLLTLHRPDNVDHKDALFGFLKTLKTVQEKIPVVFPVHPRTRAALKRFKGENKLKQMRQLLAVKPQGYFENISLMAGAAGVLTDSGGMQEEATYLKVPCLTLRPSTERPVTVTKGTNQIVHLDSKKILSGVNRIVAGKNKKSQVPRLWDGRTAERILRILSES